jgi:hypothetical protein
MAPKRRVADWDLEKERRRVTTQWRSFPLNRAKEHERDRVLSNLEVRDVWRALE